MTSIGFMRSPPKYSCSVCGKLFRRRKQKDDHILFNRCKGLRREDNKKTIKQNIVIEPELVSMKDEIVHYDPQTTIYYGRPYDYNPIPTGNRHYRCGIPLPIVTQQNIQAQSKPIMGNYKAVYDPETNYTSIVRIIKLPRISKYKRAAI